MNFTSKPAILLGSFDPPTIGHIHLISEALRVGVSCVYVIPAFGNPWKTGQTEFSHRYKMTKTLESLYQPGKVVVMELERTLAYLNDSTLPPGKPHAYIPTYYLLRELHKRFQEFQVITTNETYREIPLWINGEEILENNEFLVFSVSHLGEGISGSIEILDLPVSSTLVREALKLGESRPEYLTQDIIKYIKQNKLYT